MKKKLHIKSKDLKLLFLREKRWEIVLPWPSKICHCKRKRKYKIKKEPLCKGLTFPGKNTMRGICLCPLVTQNNITYNEEGNI